MKLSPTFHVENARIAGRPLNPAAFSAILNEIRDVGLCHVGQACPFPKRRPIAVKGRA